MSDSAPVNHELPTLPMWRKIMFALGQLGWSLASFGIGNLINFFYMPPDSGAVRIFPVFIYTGIIVGILTIIGVITFAGRLLDAFTNPFIATWSDKSKSKIGRRKLFMLISVIPFAVFSFLIFYPLQKPVVPPGSLADSMVNAVWLASCIFLLYFFFVMYVTPFTALLSELAHNPKERLQLSTMISITWALGFLIGFSAYSMPDMLFQNFGIDQTSGFQLVIGVFAIISFVLMMLPIIFIDEKKYAESHVSNESMLHALGSTFRNSNFRRYISSEFFYFICMTTMQIGMVYFIVTLLRLDKGLVTLLMATMLFASFVFYPFINILANRMGKKPLIIGGFLIFGVDFILCALMGILPIPPLVHAFAVVIIASLPMAIFGILPNALVADIAEADGIKTGNYKAGIYFGVRTFEMNLGISFANILFPSLLNLGMSIENPAGVRMAAIIAVCFCAIGLFIFTRYREKEVIAILATKEKV
jgi:GPH family glycoside/pentoside/hexuronide:cation symporter